MQQLMKSIIVAVMVSLVFALATPAHANSMVPVELQDASMFVGPVYAWNSQGKPVDPVDESYMVAFAGPQPNGSDAVPVTEHPCFDVIGHSRDTAVPEFLPTDGCVGG